jgi:hypothetical protein
MDCIGDIAGNIGGFAKRKHAPALVVVVDSAVILACAARGLDDTRIGNLGALHIVGAAADFWRCVS